MSNNTTSRTIQLTDTEKAKMEVVKTMYPTQVKRAEFYGISRSTLWYIEMLGSCQNTTVSKLRAKLQSVRLPKTATV